MEESLESYLIQLQTCVPSNYESEDSKINQKLRNAQDLTKDINNILESSQNQTIVSILLDERNGLTIFLKKLISGNKKWAQYSAIVKNIFNSFESMLKKFGQSMSHHQLVIIKDLANVIMNTSHHRGAYSVLSHIVSVSAAISSQELIEKLDLSKLSEQLFTAVAKNKTGQGQVSSIYPLIGKIAQHFPNALGDKAARIINHLIVQLAIEVKKSVPKYNTTIEEYLKALTDLLLSFHVIVKQEDLKKIHDHLFCIISEGSSSSSRRVCPRAALDMLSEHTAIFRKWLLEQYSSWFSSLKTYALHSGQKDQERCQKALKTFIDECIKGLRVEEDLGRKSTVIEFLVNNLFEIMNSNESTYKLKGLGIKALGECCFSVSDKNALIIFEFLLNKTALILWDNEITSKNLALLAVCLESIGLALKRRSTALRTDHAQQLENHCIFLVSNYVKMAEKKRSICSRSVAVFLLGIRPTFQNPLDFISYVQNIVSRSLIESSRPELDSESVGKYFDFWTKLMNFPREADLSFSLDEQTFLSTTLDEKLITACTDIIHRLDFSVIESSDSIEAVDEDGISQPKNLADWKFIHNLVDLLEHLFKTIVPKDRLENLIIPFGQEMIELSTTYPLVPDLYRLVGSVLSVMGEDLPEFHRQYYQFYISSLIDRLPHLADNILVSAVHAVLSSPAWLVISVKGTVTGALASALKMGLTNPSMAEWPLDALEHWQSILPYPSFESIMEDIVPCLEPYFNNIGQLREEVLFIKSEKKSATAASSRIATVDKDVWCKIQRRVFKLLGRLGPKCGRLAIANEDEVVARSAMGWQFNGHLEFGLPLSDMRPIIHLDAFLPRILYLVQHTSDTKVRMAACEFLHASTVFLIGKHSQRSEEIRLRQPFTPLYSKIFPAILYLAVDTDPVIRQLFADLLYQLVHWFSRPTLQRQESSSGRTLLGVETVLLIDQLMESVCSGLGASLVRELACDCLAEFLRWSVKQNTDAALREDPAAPDFLFQKIRAAATHPSAQQRLGAVLVMKKIYPIIRESDPLSSIFTMDLLAHFVVSLTMMERDPDSLATLRHSREVLYRLTRAIYRRKEIFAVSDPRRRVAPYLVHGTLSELIEFLLKNALGTNKICRDTCIRLCDGLIRPKSIKDEMTIFLTTTPLESFLSTELLLAARLDIYRWLLQYDVIEVVRCENDLVFLQKFKIFTESVARLMDHGHSGDVSDNISETVLAWLGFLKEYVIKSGQLTQLVQVELLVQTTLLPGRLGFSNYVSQSRHRVDSYLKAIFPLLNGFSESIGMVVSRDVFQPDKLNWSETTSMDILHGLILISSSGIINTKVSICKSPSRLLKLAVELALDKSCDGREKMSFQIKAANLLIELGLLSGLSMELLVSELQNPATVPDSSITLGQSLRSKLGRPLLINIIDQLKSISPFLPRMGNGDEQQWTLLREILQTVQETEKDNAEKRSWIVEQVLDSWSILEQHADSYGHRDHLRLIVESLVAVRLDAVERYSCVKNWIIDCWSHPNTDASYASELTQLLTIFRNDCNQKEEENLIASLQEFFTQHFPSKTTSLESDTDKSAYFSVMNRMLGVAHIPAVLYFLIDLFAMEPRHPSQSVFIQSIQDNSDSWMQKISDSTVALVLNKLYQHTSARTVNATIRIDAIDAIYVPILTASSPSCVERHVINDLLTGFVQSETDIRPGIETFVTKTVLCALLAAAIVRINKEQLIGDLNGKYCELKECQRSADGKDFVRATARFVMSIRKITAPVSQAEVASYEKMEGASFKLMMATASVNSSNEDVVNQLLFRPMTPELWNATVGTTQRYKLIVDVDAQRKKFSVLNSTLSTANNPNFKGFYPSQFLNNSTLNEDVYRFDFNDASVPSSVSSYVARSVSTVPASAGDQSFLFLTLDELNKHPCMVPLVCFLRQLNEKRLGTDSIEEPQWMKTLRGILLHVNSHTNVVLFIVRLVIDLEEIFRPYAKFWYEALLLALLRKVGGDPLNGLFREGLGVLLEWSVAVPPPGDNVEFARLASHLIQFIIKNLRHSISEIFKENREMLKAVFRIWNQIKFEIPFGLIESLLGTNDKAQMKLGLFVLEVIVIFGFFPKNGEEYNSRLKRCLVDLLTIEEKREITKTCAALCGSILSREADNEFEKSICVALKKWHTQQKPDDFVDLLYPLTINYQPIVASLATINLSLLADVFGNLKAHCLAVVSISWPYMEDPWKEIGFSTIESFLKGSNPAEICPVLILLKNLIPRVDVDQWKPLWPVLARLSRHQHVLVRSRLYDVYRKAFDLIDPCDPAIAQAVLRACSDENQELADEMQNFLAEKLPNSTTERLLTYVTQFSTLEEFFIPYCSHFLLERTTTNHTYRDPMFDQPLDDIPFEEVDLASLSSQSALSSWNRSHMSRTFQPGFVRATQQAQSRVAPSMTQTPANWLMTETQFVEPSSSHSTVMTPSQRSPQKPFNSPVKSWKRFTTAEDSLPQKISYSPSKIEKNALNQPTIYRKYRKGELPDIQIPPSALIAPLQAVALKDHLTAKMLFCHLLTAIRRQVVEIQGNDRDFASNLNLALESLVVSSDPRANISANVIAAILEYFWINAEQLFTDIDQMVSIVKRNRLQPLGILALESSLPTSSSRRGSSKKSKRESDHSSSSWFRVAALYGDLQDVDNVRAIVSHLTDCTRQTRKAIDKEIENDWNKAYHYYSQALGTGAPQAEVEFCQEYRLKCLEQLGRWDEIDRLKPQSEPWCTRSRVRCLLQNIYGSNGMDELERISLSSVDSSVLTDLALSAIFNENLGRANLCIAKALDGFIGRYSQLSSLNFAGRQNLLEHLCLITELQSLTQHSDSKWNVCLPDTGDDLVVWNSILTLRAFFARCEEDQPEEALSSVNSLRLLLASNALEQKNVGLARQLVGAPVQVEQSMSAFRQLIQSKITAMESCNNQLELLDKLILAKETINSIDITDVEAAGEKWKMERERFETFLCVRIYQAAQKIQPNDLKAKQDKLIELWNVPTTEMISSGIFHARRQAELAEGLTSDADRAEAYYVLAKYCYDWKSIISDEDYRLEIIRSVLASMRYGSVDGQALFPLVISAIHNHPAAANSFENYRSSVPNQLFLPWVNQLVSYSTASPAIASLLVDIAAKYPAHVRAPFGITRSNMSPENLNTNAIRSIESALPTDSTWELFLKSIIYLHPPEKVAAELLNSENCLRDYPSFRSKYLHLSPPSVTSAYGHVHHAFSLEFTAKFEDAYNNGSLKKLAGAIHFRKKTTAGRKSLRDYSQWLANYRFGDGLTHQLEIPTLKGKTLKIQGFRDDIEYFHSKQLPVRLTLVVNGALENQVLIKHGEDVRQDERIIQLLNVVDTALCRNVDSRKRKLRIRTFQVTPLTGSCGMIQWLGDTLTLKAFLETDPEFRSSSNSVKLELQKLVPAQYDFLSSAQEKLIQTYLHLADRIYPFGLKGALKKWSQSPEAYFYLRNRMANSHGALCSALWILGVGDRHLSNFLISTKTGDVIGIDYGYAFGTATSRLRWPEIVPCRLTRQFKYLIPGLGFNGSIRESMSLTLSVAKEETRSLMAALSVFVTEPTLEWEAKAISLTDSGSSSEQRNYWSPEDIVRRTENLLNGAHPSEITCIDLEKNTVFSTTEGKRILPQLLSVVRGRGSQSLVAFQADSSVPSKIGKRRHEEKSFRAALPTQGLTTSEQINCLIEQSTDPTCLAQMYYGWEPWV